jgi:hypothetical protein
MARLAELRTGQVVVLPLDKFDDDLGDCYMLVLEVLQSSCRALVFDGEVLNAGPGDTLEMRGLIAYIEAL